MRQFLFGQYAGPLLALGGLVAIACLVSTRYINRLQADLARTVRHDAAGREAAVDLQVQLRHLRVHSLVLVADPSDTRREVVGADLARIEAALATIRSTIVTPEDEQLAEKIEQDYRQYRNHLGLDRLPTVNGPMSDVARWSDAHHMSELLVPCRELAERQRERMNGSLERSETQTAWAGGVLLALGLTGVLAGLLSGYATARAMIRRVAQLSVRVQAVQAHLDQDVGAVTVVAPQHFGDLDAQLEQVVGRVKEVCQKLQEQERSLLRAEQLVAVGQLAAGVAHEIRNPLTGVKFLLQAAVQMQSPTLLTADRLHLLLQEVARIERTVQGLVDFARTPPPDRRPHELSEIVKEAAEIVQSRAETKSVLIRIDCGHAPLQVIVDRDQFLSLLTNLLLNAIEASPTKGKITVVTSPVMDGMIRVEVLDAGSGIETTVADRLFTPFASTKATGTGLGLTLARRVAEEHGGTITATNRPEGGACFTLTLPAAEESYAETPGH
jgi:two-component system, NtrC family, sensor histidine kinase HydH